MKSLSPTPNGSDYFQKEPDGANDQVNVKVVHLRGSIGFDEDSLNQIFNDTDTVNAAPTPPRASVPVVVRTAPARIYLQVDDADSSNEPFPEDNNGCVTWCDKSVMTTEVPYIRADLAAPTPPVVKESLTVQDRNAVIEECAMVLLDAAEKSTDPAVYEEAADVLLDMKSQPAAPDPRDEALRKAGAAIKDNLIAIRSTMTQLRINQFTEALAAIEDALKVGV